MCVLIAGELDVDRIWQPVDDVEDLFHVVQGVGWRGHHRARHSYARKVARQAVSDVRTGGKQQSLKILGEQRPAIADPLPLLIGPPFYDPDCESHQCWVDCLRKGHIEEYPGPEREREVIVRRKQDRRAPPEDPVLIGVYEKGRAQRG